MLTSSADSLFFCFPLSLPLCRMLLLKWTTKTATTFCCNCCPWKSCFLHYFKASPNSSNTTCHTSWGIAKRFIKHLTRSEFSLPIFFPICHILYFFLRPLAINLFICRKCEFINYVRDKNSVDFPLGKPRDTVLRHDTTRCDLRRLVDLVVNWFKWLSGCRWHIN